MPNQAAERMIAGGMKLERSGRLVEAERAYRDALAIDPGNAGLMHLLGLLLHRTGRTEEGLALVTRAAEAAPKVPEFHNNHGTLLATRGEQSAAAAAFGRAIALRPGFAAAHANLGSTLRALGRVGEAVASFRRAIALEPEVARVHALLAMALSEMGDMPAAAASSRRSVELAPSEAGSHSGMLFALLHDAGSTPRSIFEEHLAWAQRHARHLYPARLEHDNDGSPDRRLRVGYVSADFREHTRARFVAPLLSNHDRGRFEVFCYSSVVQPDAVTAEFRVWADHWREARGVVDSALAEVIRRDRIDILVELTGHMGGNRLALFARRPAPVQVAYPGYPATTGLATIDALLTDVDRDPAGMESLYTEPLIRLEVTSQCYRPPPDAPDVGDLPALRGGHVTFGVTNKLAKVTGPMVRVWSRVLHAVPGSRLLAIGPPAPADQETVRGFFAGNGLPPDRLDLAPRRRGRAYWDLHHRIDIGLDTYPYNGHPTTLDGLWMGVPAVTLAGEAHVSREGLALCRLLGLDDLVATTEAEYEGIAIGLAGELPRLVGLRERLRGRISASPLRNEAAVARRIEAAYLDLWEAWRRRRGTRSD